jgi:hypothetical protein
MKLSTAWLWIGISANAATIIIYALMATLPSGDGAGMLFVLFVFPGIWLVSIILAIVAFSQLTKKNTEDSAGLRIMASLLCTPVPILVIAFGIDSYQESNRPFYNSYYDHGRYVQQETWPNKDGFSVISGFRTADSLEWQLHGDSTLCKDSIWVYVGKQDDTVKREYYRNDQLIRTVLKKP